MYIFVLSLTSDISRKNGDPESFEERGVI